MKYFVLILISMFFLGCLNAPKNINDRLQEIEMIEEELQDSLFVKESLRDTLYAYMDYIDTIPNPYNFPIVYHMEFFKSKLDTIVYYMSNGGLIRSLEEPLLKGATQIRKKDVTIFSFDFETLSNLINKKQLSLDYFNYLDTVVYVPSHAEYLIIYSAPIWIYKYSNGHLILIKKDDRSMDQIKTKLGDNY